MLGCIDVSETTKLGGERKRRHESFSPAPGAPGSTKAVRLCPDSHRLARPCVHGSAPLPPACGPHPARPATPAINTSFCATAAAATPTINFNNMTEHEEAGMPPMFTCWYEMLLDAWRFEEPIFLFKLLP
jgi:hypothetical protein